MFSTDTVIWLQDPTLADRQRTRFASDATRGEGAGSNGASHDATARHGHVLMPCGADGCPCLIPHAASNRCRCCPRSA